VIGAIVKNSMMLTINDLALSR